MRVLMLDRPEVIDRLNRATVPVTLISPDVTLPDRPAFEPARRYLEQVPFGRTNFAWYMITGPRARTVLGCDPEVLARVAAGKPAFDVQDLMTILTRAQRIIALGRETAPERVAERQALIDEARQQVWVTGTLAAVLDPRLMTIWWLSSASKRPLGGLVGRLASDPELFVPGVKNLVVAALAEIVVTDRPLRPVHAETVRRLLAVDVRTGTVPEAERRWTGGAVPPLYRRRAAEAIETALDQRLHGPDECVVDGVAAWWRAHRDDPGLRARPPAGDYRLLLR